MSTFARIFVLSFFILNFTQPSSAISYSYFNSYVLSPISLEVFPQQALGLKQSSNITGFFKGVTRSSFDNGTHILQRDSTFISDLNLTFPVGVMINNSYSFNFSQLLNKNFRIYSRTATFLPVSLDLTFFRVTQNNLSALFPVTINFPFPWSNNKSCFSIDNTGVKNAYVCDQVFQTELYNLTVQGGNLIFAKDTTSRRVNFGSAFLLALIPLVLIKRKKLIKSL